MRMPSIYRYETSIKAKMFIFVLRVRRTEYLTVYSVVLDICSLSNIREYVNSLDKVSGIAQIF